MCGRACLHISLLGRALNNINYFSMKISGARHRASTWCPTLFPTLMVLNIKNKSLKSSFAKRLDRLIAKTGSTLNCVGGRSCEK